MEKTTPCNNPIYTILCYYNKHTFNFIISIIFFCHLNPFKFNMDYIFLTNCMSIKIFFIVCEQVGIYNIK